MYMYVCTSYREPDSAQVKVPPSSSVQKIIMNDEPAGSSSPRRQISWRTVAQTHNTSAVSPVVISAAESTWKYGSLEPLPGDVRSLHSGRRPGAARLVRVDRGFHVPARVLHGRSQLLRRCVGVGSARPTTGIIAMTVQLFIINTEQYTVSHDSQWRAQHR